MSRSAEGKEEGTWNVTGVEVRFKGGRVLCILLIAHYSRSEFLYYKRPLRSGEVFFFHSGVLWRGLTEVRTVTGLRTERTRKKVY